ncbi:MAG: FAD-dependent oxidoreductase [Candidatus Omnitrophica bacterium]|jgi:NADH-quinone oxidoreductase subunit F|nr:FAD-dependent oxidoreductase [Candidatus Omnitrophota bacterium]
MKIMNLNDLQVVREKGLSKIFTDRPRIAVGLGTCGIGNGADQVYKAFASGITKRKLKINLTKVGCFGFCVNEPLVNIAIPGNPLVILQKVTTKDVKAILDAVSRGNIPEKKALCRIEKWDHLTGQITYGQGLDAIPLWNQVDFFKWQKKIVLRDCGLINPEDIQEYIAVGGYSSIAKVINGMSPEQVIEEVKLSKLRGRGGAGFPTGRKWELMKQEKADKKYIVCNADEGDPGAYMNRNEIESDPHMLIEGMLIAAFAMGGNEGIIYIRAEYPLAVERLQKAILQAQEYGFLGKNILGSNFCFDIHLVEGAGAFVCGEETALIASIEGRRGMPCPRPPFPAQKGIWNKPTNINNVETYCNIPAIIAKGGSWFNQTGTEKSSGTKVFSLVGKIKNTGLVELALGESLLTLIYNIGQGTGTKKKVKAVQTGGPSGGCIPVELFKTPVDYESLNALGAIMGSGGMVVMDDDNCMVDVARYFTEFTTSESCGKCTPCREGLYQSLNTLNAIAEGKANLGQLLQLESLGEVIKDTALCGLGQTGPNPILTTMKYFRNEYLEHIQGKHCDAGVCKTLFLSPCENSCPLHMNIPGFLELIKEDRLLDAFDLIYRDNPIPSSSGRICHFHCKMRCRREDLDQPVSQGEVHRFVADQVYKLKKEPEVLRRFIKEKMPKTGKKVAVIGAGPAGFTAAFYLVRLGHEVVVFEEKSQPGGILRYGIPEYRLPKKILAKELGFIKKLGVKFVFNKKVNSERLKQIRQDYDAVFLATGSYQSMFLQIPGEEFPGVYSATHFLEEVLLGKKIDIGKEVLIIGAGNAAIDAARTAWRLGAKVTVVYRREKQDMPANKDEIREAEAEGIKFVFLASPKAILADAQKKVKALEVVKMLPGGYDFAGRKIPEATNETYQIPCDTVMVAIGERVDSEFIRESGINLNKNGTVKIDGFTLKANVSGYYAGGDLVTGPSTAVEAMGYGKKAAQVIDKELTGKDRFIKLFKKHEYRNKVPLKPARQSKQSGKFLPVGSRLCNFKEVSQGLSRKQVDIEASRCLRCDVKEEALIE